jgi:hypothetical protein
MRGRRPQPHIRARALPSGAGASEVTPTTSPKCLDGAVSACWRFRGRVTDVSTKRRGRVGHRGVRAPVRAPAVGRQVGGRVGARPLPRAVPAYAAGPHRADCTRPTVRLWSTYITPRAQSTEGADRSRSACTTWVSHTTVPAACRRGKAHGPTCRCVPDLRRAPPNNTPLSTRYQGKRTSRTSHPRCAPRGPLSRNGASRRRRWLECLQLFRSATVSSRTHVFVATKFPRIPAPTDH